MPIVVMFMMDAPPGSSGLMTLPLWHNDAVSDGGVHTIALRRRHRPQRVCAVIRRRFPVGARPTRRMLQPEATGAAREVTNWLKPSECESQITVTARVCGP